MKNFVNNFESAIKVINETKDERKVWHKQEKTLARLLRIAQEKKMLSFTTPLFKSVGLPTNGKVTQTNIVPYFVNFVEIKVDGKPTKVPAYVRRVPVYEKDESGKVKLDKEGHRVQLTDKSGNLVTIDKLTAVRPGTWTLEKLLRCCAKV